MEESLKPKTPIVNIEGSLKPKAATSSAEGSLKPSAVEGSLKPRTTTGGAEGSLKPSAVEGSLKPKLPQIKTGAGNAVQMNNDRTGRVNEDARLDGTSIYIDDKKYKVVKLISESSTEAQIYLVEANGKKYAFKHYYSSMPLREDNIEILGRISRLNGMTPTLVVPVYCFGQYSQSKQRFLSFKEGDRPVGGSRCFELMAYGEGGNLDDYCIKGDQERFRNMAILLASSIDLLHQKQILHRDIKPANYFFLDKEKRQPVVTDFGLASLCNSDGTIETKDYFNSPVYAAPEMYLTPPGLEAIYHISTKSDFYALGLVLVSIWMGHDAFLKHYVGGDEFGFRAKKAKGKLPIPEDLDERNRSLLMALLDNDDQTRASFEEISEWAEGKTNPFAARLGKTKALDEDAFSIIYDRSHNIVAHSTEELAHLLLTRQSLGQDYLYNGYLSQEFSRLKHPELVSMVGQVTEKFPKDKVAGLFSFAMKLDANVPYIDVEGNEMAGLQEIAKAINNNFDKYLSTLTNPFDYLYMYLQAHGGKVQADKLLKGMQKKETRRSALQRFISEIDPKAPFRIVTLDGIVRLCYDVDAVINVWTEGFSDESWSDLTDDGFEAWLSVNNPIALGRVNDALERLEEYSDEDNFSKQKVVLYNLNPECCDYFGDLDPETTDRCFTIEDLCRQFNIWLVGYDTSEEDTDWFDTCDRSLNDLANFAGGGLHVYLDSKLKYQKQIDLIEKMTDVYSDENTKKYAPNNWQICCYKTLMALGHRPFYIFRDRENQPVYTLGDLGKIPVKEQREHLRNWGLGNWLTILFHEDPTRKFTRKYAFEGEVKNYLACLARIDSDNNYVKRFYSAKVEAEKYTNNAKSSTKRFTLALAVAGVGVIALLAAAIGLLVWGLPLEGWNPMTFIAFPAAFVVAAIAFVVTSLRADDAGCIAGIIAGAILGALTYALFWAIGRFALPYIAYVLGALLLAYAVHIAYQSFRDRRDVSGRFSEVLSPGFMELTLEPLHYAFVEEEGKCFDSSIGDKSRECVSTCKGAYKAVFKRGVIGTILGLLTSIGFYGYSPAFNDNVHEYVNRKAHEQTVVADSLATDTTTAEPVVEPVKKKAKAKKTQKTQKKSTATSPTTTTTDIPETNTSSTQQEVEKEDGQQSADTKTGFSLEPIDIDDIPRAE